MKLIKRLFGKKDVKPTLISLELSELPEWMKVRSENVFDKLHQHIQQKYGEIEVAIGELNVSKEQLNEVNTVDEAYRQIAKAGISNKDNVVKNIDIIINRTIIPHDTTIPAANEFYTSTKSSLKTLIENTMRSQQYAKALFPEGYRGVMDNLSHLNTLLDELMSPINEKQNQLDAYDRLKTGIENIGQFQKQIAENEKTIPDLENKYGSLENELHNLEAELEVVVKSDEFAKAYDAEKQIKALKSSLSDIDSNVKSLFAPLSKALLRMEKQDESGRHKMSPKSKKILLAIKDDPTLISNNDINSFLDEIKTRIEDGTLGLKQQKMNNTIKQLDKLKDSDILFSLSDKNKSYLSELEDVKSELNLLTIYEKKTKSEKDISDYRSKTDSIKNELETEHNDQTALKVKIEQSMTELNSDLKFVFGTNVEVINSFGI